MCCFLEEHEPIRMRNKNEVKKVGLLQTGLQIPICFTRYSVNRIWLSAKTSFLKTSLRSERSDSLAQRVV